MLNEICTRIAKGSDVGSQLFKTGEVTYVWE